MKDVNEIRKRMKNRKGNAKPLSDRMFSNVYNTMIKFMVVLIVGLLMFSYSKTNSLTRLYENVLDKTNLTSLQVWFNTHVYNAFELDETVSSTIQYQSLGEGYFTNYSNEVKNLQSGKVIYSGLDNGGMHYVTVLLENNVQVTYNNMESVDVDLYSVVTKGCVLGSYLDKVGMSFEYLGDEINYEQYQGME